MLTGLLMLWLMLFIARGTPTGDAMHRVLVERPAAWLSRIRRGNVLFWAMTLSIIVAVIWMLGEDGRMLVTGGLPEFVTWAAAIDLSALLDLAFVAMLAASTVRTRTIRHWIAAKIAPYRPRARRPRVRRARKPANDDEDRRAWVAALAA